MTASSSSNVALDLADAAGIKPDSDAPSKDGAGLKKRTFTAGLWQSFGFAFDQGLSLVSNIMLVYFALPDEAFGIMAVILVVIQGLQMFSDIGIQPCLIQNKRQDSAFYNTAWTMQVVRGIALWLIACAVAYPMSLWKGDTELVWLLPLAAFTSVFNGFRSTAWITAQRRLDIRLLSILKASFAVVRIGSMALVAWSSPTALALVVGLLVNSMLLCVASHWMIKEIKNRFRFERKAFGELIRYGRWLFFSTVITFFAGAIDKIFLYDLMSAAALGVFFIGSRFAEIGPMFFKQMGQIVGFPALSDVYRRDPERFKVALLKLRLVLTIPINLLLLSMIALGPTVTWFFYGNSPTPGFIEAGWIIQVLCFNSLAGMVTTSYGQVFMASGRTVYNMWSVFAQLVVMVAATLTGYYLAGEMGFILGIGLTQWAKYVVDAGLAKRCGCWQWKFDASVMITCGVLAMGALWVSDWLAWRFVL